MIPGLRSACLTLVGLIVLLAGCGPGVGGTGTGDGGGNAAFDATAEPLCSADFAARLDCGVVSPGAPVSAGTAPVLLADAAPQSRVQARVEGNSIVLQAPCSRLAFSGTWGRSPTLGTRFFGTVTVDGVGAPASLGLLAGDSGFAVAVFAQDGGSLFGPVTLQRVSAETTPAPCP